MSEYIITVHDDADPDGGHRLTKPAEPLVRCRDCKHYSEHEWVIATDVSDVCNF